MKAKINVIIYVFIYIHLCIPLHLGDSRNDYNIYIHLKCFLSNGYIRRIKIANIIDLDRAASKIMSRKDLAYQKVKS